MPTIVSPELSTEELLKGHRASAEKRAALLAGAKPFDVEDWLSQSTPATPEELQDMEAFLADLESERRRSIALELASRKCR